VPRYDLNGRVALVTGAARGIGYETAREIHARGGRVVLADLDADEAAAAAARLGERALGLRADVSETGEVEGAVAAATERFGGLDVAVANAGIAPAEATTVRQADPGEWERIIDVNLVGVWRTARAALPQVVERRGQIIVVSSVYAFFNGVLNSAYAATKAGVESFGRALRTELAPHGASAGVAYFGFIDTRMVRDTFDSEDPVAERFRERVPAFAARRLPPAAAGVAIADGLEKRAPRIMAPGWLRGFAAMRGLLNPVLDRRMEREADLIDLVREAEREPERAAPPPP